MRLLQLKNDSLRLEKSHCENLQNTEKRSEKEMQPSVDTLKALGWWYVTVLFGIIKAR